MGRRLGVVAVVAVAFSAGLVVLVAVMAGAGADAGGGDGDGSGGQRAGAASARPAIPTTWVTWYREAAATCPGLTWTVLAGIGTVESDNGRSSAPGVASGANAAGAEGPMQFEPATFRAYATSGPGGARPPSPYDPVDAAYTAATMLCADGGGRATTLRSALLDYNHSATYADTVLTLAVAFGQDAATTELAVAALSYAAAQLGVPYRWGGTGAGGFDCSGLVQAAYQRAGVSLPRVAQAQFDAGPALAGGALVEPGDLVFYGTGPGGVDHVGLYVGGGEMIDAPHTGANVRLDAAAWPDLVGATRPG